MGHDAERVSGEIKDEAVFPEEEALDENRDEWEEAEQEPEDVRVLVAEEKDSGKRADVFFAEILESTRSHVQLLLNEGRVSRRDKPVKPNYRIKTGDEFQIVLPRPVPLEAEPEDIPLDIIYEDDDVIVLNKPRGMVVHPAPGHYNGTLVNALLYHCKNLSGINGVIRPGIVHRLDKDTSGIMIVAKNDEAHVSLSKQIQEKRLCICKA